MVISHKNNRVPLGVKIISIVYLAASALMFLAACIVLAASAAIVGLLSNFASSFSKIALSGPLALNTSGTIMLLIAIMGFFIGAYLWRLKNWARVMALIFAGLSILSGIHSLFLQKYQVIGWIALNIIIFGYLFWAKIVKEAFKR